MVDKQNEPAPSSGPSGETEGNGHLHPLDELRRSGLVCGVCKFAAGFALPTVSPNQTVGQMMCLIVCECQNKNSAEYGRLNSQRFSCPQFERMEKRESPKIVRANAGAMHRLNRAGPNPNRRRKR